MACLRVVLGSALLFVGPEEVYDHVSDGEGCSQPWGFNPEEIH